MRIVRKLSDADCSALTPSEGLEQEGKDQDESSYRPIALRYNYGPHIHMYFLGRIETLLIN
jgi:hypothetical protein